jgi:hypothetical protein
MAPVKSSSSVAKRAALAPLGLLSARPVVVECVKHSCSAMQSVLALTQQQAALRRSQTAARTSRRRQCAWVQCRAVSTAAAEASVKLPATHLQASAAALQQLQATKGVNRESKRVLHARQAAGRVVAGRIARLLGASQPQPPGCQPAPLALSIVRSPSEANPRPNRVPVWVLGPHCAASHGQPTGSRRSAVPSAGTPWLTCCRPAHVSPCRLCHGEEEQHHSHRFDHPQRAG